jgi:5-formyltetrahydrofolate cyclo-ligase|tara:strand:+ start:148 stop:696 length:549 start_codon:yes stop_codon:yes gene_type:complete
MRKKRRSLSPKQQLLAKENIARKLSLLPIFYNSKRIAFYLAHDGEIDPMFAMGIAEAAGKECYLPLLHPLKQNRLYFAKYKTGEKLSVNRFGIQEPPLRGSKIVPAFAIDLILMPLVAFDASCNRIGMGGGFYDRTLKLQSRLTKLVGLAQSFQETSSINKYPWDVTLEKIVTEKNVISRCK